MSDELLEKIETNASAPKTASVDGRSATQHDLSDQIEAQKFLDSRTIAKKASRLVFNQIVPPGAS